MRSVNGQPAAVCSTHSHSWRVCAVNLLSLERFSISAPFRSCLTLCCVTVIDSALRTLINPSGGRGEVSEAAVSFGTTRSVFESLSFSCCIFKGGKKIQRNSDKSCYWLKCVCLDICLVQDKLGYKVKTLHQNQNEDFIFLNDKTYKYSYFNCRKDELENWVSTMLQLERF